MFKRISFIMVATAMLVGCNPVLFGANINPILANPDDVKRLGLENTLVFLAVTNNGEIVLFENPEAEVEPVSKQELIDKVDNLTGLETATITAVTYPGSHCVWAGGFEKCYPPH